MKKFYSTVLAVFSFVGISLNANAQHCVGVLGPNLLGAKGTFSAPFITVNNSATACTQSNTNTYNPTGNIGNALPGCNTNTPIAPCSDYTYTAASNGLSPEGRYSIIKTVGNSTGSNCIKLDWRGSDHTGDGGYFMLVNGAPNTSTSPIFYKIRNIALCVGATYEFSAWVINVLPAGHPAAIAGSQPNISFRVNGQVIATSGLIAYTATPTWVKVTASFTATTSVADLEVINATAVASGNDLGLDDISLNICGSQVASSGPATVQPGNSAALSFSVTDASQTHTWYKLQLSTNSGASFTDITAPAQGSYIGNTLTVNYNTGIVNAGMNGHKYRMVVATTQAGLVDPSCNYFNDFTLVVPDGGPLPVSLIAFNGKHNNGVSTLDWQTSQEWNSSHFDVLRSLDGRDFKSVATLDAAGNSNTLKNYTFNENISGSGYVYYRLRQVDVDGKSTLSDIVRLRLGNSKEVSFDLYPNPFVDNLNASFTAGKNANATLVIRNINGQVLFTKTINVIKGSNTVQLNNLPVLSRGMYHVSILNEDINYQGKIQKL
jgi:hypothetical protein